MVKQLWEYWDKCVWKNRLAWINLLLSKVQWSITILSFCIDVHIRILHKIFHHFHFTQPEVTWTKRHAWMINRIEVDDHTVCIVSGRMTLCTIIILVNNHSNFNYIINTVYTLFGYIQRMMISSFCGVASSKENLCMSIQYVAYLEGFNNLLSSSPLDEKVSCGRFKVKVKFTLCIDVLC